MRLRSLTRLLEVARAVAEPRRLVIIGSASLLPAHPELGDTGQPLEVSYDADFLLDPMDEELAAILGEAIGQQSLFTKRYGYYADILRPVMAETLPVLNFTGGNKLMATAAFRWAAKRSVRAFYLERGNQIIWFEPRDGDMLTHSEPLPTGITNDLDAAALLSCQFGDEVVLFQGERLTLNDKGAKVAPQDLAAKLQGETRLDRGAFDFRKWLHLENLSPREPNEGDNLEYGTACALLKAGVPAVRRSVELATLPNSRNSEGELDLVFNWNGRLWVVDCKDRVGGDAKVESLRTLLLGDRCSNRQTEVLLKSMAEDLKDRDIKILREDLLQISEVGGLLGCTLAVRSSKPPQQALEFAASRHPHVEILLKADLVKCLPAILAGRRPR